MNFKTLIDLSSFRLEEDTICQGANYHLLPIT